MSSKPLRDLSDAPAVALPRVIETMDAYLEAAVNVVCTVDAVGWLLGDLEQVPDEVCGPVAATLVAAYMQGAAVLHAAMMQGGQHAEV